MRLVRLVAAAVIAAAFFVGGSRASASFLDEYLHNMRLDQRSPEKARDRSQWRMVLTEGHTYGQTFTTGPDVEEICRITIEVPHFAEDWSPGTSLVMALYDGPAKAQKLAESAMKYEWRSWEDYRVVFPMQAKAEPNHVYYIELHTEGGEGKAGPVLTCEGDYPRGEGYVDGKPVDFDFVIEDYVRAPWDRDKTYAEQFAKINMEMPGLERVKAAVAAEDWDAAAKALIAHFESRTDLMDIVPVPAGGRKPDPAMVLIELAADMKIRDADGNILSLGPNWNHLKWWPTRGGVGLTREGIRKHLAGGYAKTGDEKYAKSWTSLLKAFFVDLPSPIKAGVVPAGAKDIAPNLRGGIDGGSMWSGLSIAARMRHGFWYYKTFAKSPNFPWDVKAAFIMNLVDMADMLAIEKGGGNWADQMNVALFEFGRDFPEYARAPEFARQGFDGLIDSMRKTMLPDGPIGESAGYQMLVHNTWLGMFKDAHAAKLYIPRDVYRNAERALAFHMLTSQPDGNRPCFGDALGDTNRNILQKAYDEFGRRDMQWVATAGEKGTPPAQTSVEFPYSKYYVMRDKWSPDALYMCLKNGRTTSHGHFDSLGFVMWAYGNPIFVDPGVYIYGTPDTIRLMGTPSHCTVTIDGKNLANGGGPNQFFRGKGIDYFWGQGPEYSGLPLSIRTVRRVAFLKPDYWVFSDVVRGDGEHQVDSRFHFADTDAALDANTGVARTTHKRGGNLELIPVDAAAVSTELEQGDTAFVHEKRAPALILRQSAKTALPFRMDNVLYPYRGKSAGAKVTKLQPGGGAGVETSGVKVETKSGVDYVGFADSADRAVSFADAGFSMRAQCGVVRTTRRDTVKSFAWVWGSKLEHRGTVLAKSDRPLAGLDVVYSGDTIVVTTQGEEPTLRIAALGAKNACINGAAAVAIDIDGGFFRPFSGNTEDSVLVDNEMPGFIVERPLKGESVGGEDQVGFNFLWGHVSPGRDHMVSYTADIRGAGSYEVLALVPTFRLVEVTHEAHYTVIPSGGKPVDLKIDQAAAEGTWVSLGTYRMQPGRARVELRADAEVSGPTLVADAVRWVRKGE